MKLKDIMTRNVLTIAPDVSIAAAAQRMQEANVGCLVVAGSDVQGIMTDRDIAVGCVAQAHDPRSCPVWRHMNKPITAGPDVEILDAAHLMVEKRIKRLPVMDGGKLTGLVSFSDVALALDKPMHDLLVGMGSVRKAA